MNTSQLFFYFLELVTKEEFIRVDCPNCPACAFVRHDMETWECPNCLVQRSVPLDLLNHLKEKVMEDMLAWMEERS